jgi:4,5-dihydroxyphthalate decarboxylase
MAKDKPQIKLGIPDHYRIRALIEGQVGIEGYELDITHDFKSTGERHFRFTAGEFDVGEFSTATYLRTKEKGGRFLALPVFFERSPLQRYIFYCEGRLKHPSELKGKKIGCFRYGATAVVWARGFLLDEYGLRTTDMGWYVSGKELYIGQELPVKVERLDPPAPFDQEKLHLSRLVSEGILHAAIVPGAFGYLGVFGGDPIANHMGQYPGVKPLFDDTEEIIRYIREKRIYPIIHTVAIKTEVAEKYPDLPSKLIDAFRAAKDLSPQYMSPQEISGYEGEKKILEEDPYAYVLGETEKRTIQALNRYQIEQGLMKKELPLESLFFHEASA